MAAKKKTANADTKATKKTEKDLEQALRDLGSSLEELKSKMVALSMLSGETDDDRVSSAISILEESPEAFQHMVDETKAIEVQRGLHFIAYVTNRPKA